MAGRRKAVAVLAAISVVTIALLAGVGVIFFASDSYQYHLTNVTGSQPNLKLFGATDTAGKKRTAEDYTGRITVLYMGFTHCPDICPTTLAKLHAALDQVGPKTASNIQVLFETVDPGRDTLALMKRYTRAFDPRFRGLRLTGEALQKLEHHYHISVSYEKPNANGDYQVNHSSGVFVFGGDGDMRLIGSGATPVSDWAADLDHLAAGLD